MSFKRPSGKPLKGSLDSTTSSSGTNAHSQRSSFAMERASLDANRSSLQMFANMPLQPRASVEAGYQNLEAACRQMGIPEFMCKRYLSDGNGMYMLQHKQTDVDQQQLLPLQAEHVFSMAVAAFYLQVSLQQDVHHCALLAACRARCGSAGCDLVDQYLSMFVGFCRYMRLAVVPDNTPLPMTMLSKLWQLPGQGEAENSANLLQQLGIMRVAFLYDGSAWALVDTGHLKHLQVAHTSQLTSCLFVADSPDSHVHVHAHTYQFASMMLQQAVRQAVRQAVCRQSWPDLPCQQCLYVTFPVCR